MAWRKSPQTLIDRFERIVPLDPDIARRKMFGYPSAFTRGHLFVGLHQEDIVFRLGEKDRAALLKKPGARVFEPMPGRPMRDFVAVSPGAEFKDADLSFWAEKARAYAESLPAKAPRKKAKAPAKRG